MDVILDSNVIGGIAASRSPQREEQLERVKALRAGGARILITPTVLTEIGAAYRSQSTLEKLVTSLRETCDGLLSLGADEILKIEATEADPRATVMAHPVLRISQLDDLEAALQNDDVKAFHEQGGFGNKSLKHLLEVLGPVAKSVRKDLTTFNAFVDDRRHDCLGAIVSRARDKGDLPSQTCALEELWKRGAAWRFMTLVYSRTSSDGLQGPSTKEKAA